MKETHEIALQSQILPVGVFCFNLFEFYMNVFRYMGKYLIKSLFCILEMLKTAS